MRTVFAGIFRLIVIFLAILSIVATIFVLLYLSFNHTLLNPQIVRQAFTTNKVYERVPAVVIENFSLIKGLIIDPCGEIGDANSCNGIGSDESTGKLGVESVAFLNGLNSAQWTGLITYLLTPEIVHGSMDSSIDEIIAYFKGERDRAGLSLINLKTRLSSLSDEDLTSLLLDSQPPCTLDQQTFIMSGEFGNQASAPVFCATTGGTAHVLGLDLQRRLDNLASELPDYVVLIIPTSSANPPALRQWIGENRQATLQKLSTSQDKLPLLPIALLILVTIFGVRSLRSLLRWWGIPLFISGLLTLILCMTLLFAFDLIWVRSSAPNFSPALVSGFEQISRDVSRSLATELSTSMIVPAGIVAVLGLLMILISTRVPPPPDPSLPPLAPPGTPGGPVLNPNRKKKKW